MCNCIKVLSDPGAYSDIKGRLVTSVELPTAIRWDRLTNRVTGVTISIALISVDGRASKEKFTLDHTFCPFCGAKYGEDVANNQP